MISLMILSVSRFSGVASMSMPKQVLMTGYVVKQTIIPKKNVQIGSAISQSGLILIMIAAMTTPTDWMMSPIMWMKAALMLVLSFCEMTEILPL